MRRGAALRSNTRSPLPHLRRDWAHRCHICAGTGLTGAFSQRREIERAGARAAACDDEHLTADSGQAESGRLPPWERAGACVRACAQAHACVCECIRAKAGGWLSTDHILNNQVCSDGDRGRPALRVRSLGMGWKHRSARACVRQKDGSPRR